MKKALLLASLLIVTAIGFCQEDTKSVYLGLMPMGNLSIKSTTTGELITGFYTFNKPLILIGGSFGDTGFSQLLEFSYVEKIPLNGTLANRWGANIYYQKILLPESRLQFQLNAGAGISSYNYPRTLLFNISGKGRALFFINSHFALFGGVQYLHSVLSKKYTEVNYGLDAGLVYYLSERYRSKGGGGSLLSLANESLTIHVNNDWGTPLNGAKVTLVTNNKTVKKRPTIQGNTFVYEKIHPGEYTITIEREGYRTLTESLFVRESSKYDAHQGTTMAYNLESPNNIGYYVTFFQAINDATVERTDGFITYYVAKSDLSNESKRHEFWSHMGKLMDNVHYKLVMKNEKHGIVFRNLTEEKIKHAKNNKNLRVPPILDINGSCAFFTNQLKDNPAMAELYKAQFTNTLKQYLECTDDIKWFCDGSPYQGDLLKGFDIRSILEKSRAAYKDHVYYLTPDSGYIINNNYSYAGGILNKEKHGQGRLDEPRGYVGTGLNFVVEDYYEGSFKNDMMDGEIYHKQVVSNYRTLTGSIYYSSGNKPVTIEERGTMVNGKWNGEVDYLVSAIFQSLYTTDHVKYQYNHGNIVNITTLDDQLTRKINQKLGNDAAKDEAWKRKVASLTENEIMSYVKSINEENYGGAMYYYVTFNDDLKGTVMRESWGDWKWTSGHHHDDLFTDFRKAHPNTKNEALLELYKYLNDVR